MIVVKLTISYERGLVLNKQDDLKTEKDKGAVLEDGSIIRGLGTKFKSQADMELVRDRDRAANEIRDAFRSRFLATPIDGLYIVSQPGIAKKFADSLRSRTDIEVRCTEFKLSAQGGLNESELREWSDKVRRQLSAVSLGRKKEADEDGLRSLEALASCPVLGKNTADKVKSLVALVRAEKMEKVELKRSLETLDIEIDQTPLVAPRSLALEPA